MMKSSYYAKALLAILFSSSLYAASDATNLNSNGTIMPNAQPSQKIGPTVGSQVPANTSGNQAGKSIQGTDALGKSQTTIIDANGNLKIQQPAEPPAPVNPGPERFQQRPPRTRQVIPNETPAQEGQGQAINPGAQPPQQMMPPGQTQVMPQNPPPAIIDGRPAPGAGMPGSSNIPPHPPTNTTVPTTPAQP